MSRPLTGSAAANSAIVSVTSIQGLPTAGEEGGEPAARVGAQIRPEQRVVIHMVVVAGQDIGPHRRQAVIIADEEEAARVASGGNALSLHSRALEVGVGDKRAAVGFARADAAARAGQRIYANHRGAGALYTGGAARAVIGLGDQLSIGRFGKALPRQQAARLVDPLA